jgi:hypothetical protein
MNRREAWDVCLARRAASWAKRTAALAVAATDEQKSAAKETYKREWNEAADEWDKNIDEWIRASQLAARL